MFYRCRLLFRFGSRFCVDRAAQYPANRKNTVSKPTKSSLHVRSSELCRLLFHVNIVN